MHAPRKRLGDLLLKRGFVDEHDLSAALATQRETQERLGTILVNRGTITDHQLLECLSELFEAPIWDLLIDPPSSEALGLVSLSVCARFCALPVKVEDGQLLVALPNLYDIDAIDYFSSESKLQVVPVLASERLILAKIEELAGNSGDMGSFVDDAMEYVKASELDEEDERGETISEKDTAPVMALVNQMIQDAIHRKASDIHVEPCRNNVEIRMRIDGMMMTVRTFPTSLLRMVVARVKVMSELDISIKRKPQDGRFNIKIAGKSIDVRVSVLPTHYGERVVMRILDVSYASLSLAELGFSKWNVATYEEMISRPYGLILVTGPTGSGKTTTLYASLNALCDSTKTIMTCEDPIEYAMDGVAQSQVNERAGLTFASQLRTILRQDPDVILVGEIRDGETATTAMRASITGHMVLSTLHCNDSISALPRLFDMGVESYLLSTTLTGVVAQRLVRRLCPDCRREDTPTAMEKAIWKTTGGVEGKLERVFRGVGCGKCFQTGYRGRVGVHEILPVTLELAGHIALKAPVEELLRIATNVGFRSMQADTLMRVADGVTSFDEARRVVVFNTIGLDADKLAA